MNVRLCDLVKLESNDLSCVLLKIKDETIPTDLIKLGFDGNETYLRLMKDPTNPSVTVFRKEGQPITMNYGSSTTVVSGPLRSIRDQIIEAVTLDFGIYVTGEHHRGKSYDELVSATLGERDVNSSRHYELQSGDRYRSLFVNDQHVALIEPAKYDHWMKVRGINPIAQARYDNREIGYLMPRDEALERPFSETFERANPSEQDIPLSQAIDRAYALFDSGADWQGLSSKEAVSKFTKFAKREIELAQIPTGHQEASKKPLVKVGEIDDDLVYPGYTDMGPYYLSEAAFNAKEGVCYIPTSGFEDITGDEEPGAYPLELCDYYTHQDFIGLSHGSQEMAQALFDHLDGRSPETIILEMEALSLDDLIDKAADRAAEKNVGRTEANKDRQPPGWER